MTSGRNFIGSPSSPVAGYGQVGQAGNALAKRRGQQIEVQMDAHVLSGGCQCGAVRYAVAAQPLEVYVCHCLECRKQSASAFGISVIVPTEAFTLLRGDVATWRRPADSGRIVECLFCTACGSRIRHTEPGGATVSVKGGSLDTPPDLSAAMHIWTSRRLLGVAIPHGAVTFAEEPG